MKWCKTKGDQGSTESSAPPAPESFALSFRAGEFCAEGLCAESFALRVLR